MHNSQEIASRIKFTARQKGESIGEMLQNCDLGKNALSSMQSRGYSPRLDTITKIADYLDCSVDYLLGRTDNPEIVENIHISDNNGSVIAGGDATNVTITNSEKNVVAATDSITQEFVKIFCNLSFDDKFEVMQLLMEKRCASRN